MGGSGSKQDQQELEKEIEKKIEKELEKEIEKELEKEFDKINIPKEQKKKFFKIAKKEAIKMGKEELKKNKKEIKEEIKEDIKEDPVVWCPKDDKSSCTVFQRSEKPTKCIGDFTKEHCERSRLKKIRKQNLPSVSTLYSQRKNLRKGSLQLNEPMVWCSNEDKTSCVASPRSKKPIGCIGDFSKEQCERSRLTKIKVKQNSPVVNTLVTQRTQQRNVGFRREAPKAWCPKIEKGKAVCEYRTLDSTCKPPSFSEQQCIDKFPCQLIKTYQGSDKEKLKNLCRIMGDGKSGKDMCLSDNPQRNAKEIGAHCVWKGEVCLANRDLLETAKKEDLYERDYDSLCKAHSFNNNKCETNYDNYREMIRRPFKNNESNLCKTFYN
tara:strand:- start:11990 stop:13129 length:1140 start_codon:yes stop_codon:yes gene_type:complete